MVVRLVSTILASIFLPLGIAFTIFGLVVDDVDRGEPETFLYLGIALGSVGAVLTLVSVVLWRREAERRRRRREGLRTTAEVVRADFNHNVRSGGSVGLNLTVRFPSAGTPDGTVSRTMMGSPTSGLTEGARIEILYDPADPSNFEPA